MAGAPMEEWQPGWKSTWALKDESWTLMGFDEARELQKEREEEEEEEEKNSKKGKFWDWYNGKYTGARSLG